MSGAWYRCLVCRMTRPLETTPDGEPGVVWWSPAWLQPKRVGPFCSMECVAIFKAWTEGEQFAALFGPFRDIGDRHNRREAVERTRQRFASRHARGGDTAAYEPRWQEIEPEAPCLWRHEIHAPAICPDCATQLLRFEGVMK